MCACVCVCVCVCVHVCKLCRKLCPKFSLYTNHYQTGLFVPFVYGGCLALICTARFVWIAFCALCRLLLTSRAQCRLTIASNALCRPTIAMCALRRLITRAGQNCIYMHRIWPYNLWFPCQKYRIYTLNIWFWPTLLITVPVLYGKVNAHICIKQTDDHNYIAWQRTTKKWFQSSPQTRAT